MLTNIKLYPNAKCPFQKQEFFEWEFYWGFNPGVLRIMNLERHTPDFTWQSEATGPQFRGQPKQFNKTPS